MSAFVFGALRQHWTSITKGKDQPNCCVIFNQMLKKLHIINAPFTYDATSRKTSLDHIKDTLRKIISHKLPIDNALYIFINIYDNIPLDISPSEITEFIVYFVCCIILQNHTKSNDTFIVNQLNQVQQFHERDSNLNILLQFLLDDFLPNLRLSDIKFQYISQKTYKIGECLSYHVNTDSSYIIMDYMGASPMYDFIEFVIYFMHFAQISSNFHVELKKYVSFKLKQYTEFNTVSMVIFEMYYRQNMQNMLCDYNRNVIWKISHVLFAILIENKKRHQLYGTNLTALEVLVNNVHPIPFRADPNFWLNVIQFHYNDDAEAVSLCFGRIFSSRFFQQHEQAVGFYLFAPYGYTMGYEMYCDVRIDYENEKPNYDAIYNDIVVKYILNKDWSQKYDSDLSVFHWFLRDSIGYFETLWKIQRNLGNYSQSAHTEFVSFFVKCIDNKAAIDKINRLYPTTTRLYSSLWSDFPYKCGVLTLGYLFKMISDVWNTKQPYYYVWRELVMVMHRNGWHQSIQVD